MSTESYGENGSLARPKRQRRSADPVPPGEPTRQQMEAARRMLEPARTEAARVLLVTDEILTTPELARRLQLSESSIYRLTAEGLPFRRMAGTNRYVWRAVVAWVEAGNGAASEPAPAGETATGEEQAT